MAIKLKNKVLTLLTAIMIAGGILFTARGILLERQTGSFSQNDFQSLGEVLYLKDYLANFDEKTLTLDNINEDQINNYRYRYGNLEDQVRDVTEQYKKRISEATDAKEEKQVEKLTAERDGKIDELVSNFTDGTVVKKKILAGANKEILAARKGTIEIMEQRLNQLNAEYYYYLKDETGHVYKNINNVTSDMKAPKIKKELEKQGIGIAIPVELNTSTNNLGGYIEGFSPFDFDFVTLKGYYAYVENTQGEQNYLDDLSRERSWKMGLSLGLIMLASGVGLFINYLKREFDYPKLGTWLQRVPIDIRLGAIIISTLVGVVVTLSFATTLVYLLIVLVIAIPSLLLFLPLLKDLWFSLTRKNEYPSIKTQLNNSFTLKPGKLLANWFLTLSVGLQFVTLVVIGVGLMLVILTSVIDNYYYITLLRLLFKLFTVYLLIIFVSFVINVLQSMAEARRLLSKPAQTMSVFKQEAVSSESFAEIEASLNEMETIVFNSQAHHVRNEELKTELLTNVSHDLRTPLTSIITYGDLLTKPDLTAENRQEYTEIINQKALRMKHLINDLFEVTKMNNGEIQLTKSEVNLGQLLQQTVAEYGEEFEQAELKLLYTKPEEPVMVMLDGERIWRVFDNLIGNVVKYAMPKTRIYLKLSEAEQQVTIELKNISRYELNEEADNLVERFARGDEARNTEGSGLGLAIAHSIVALHGGDLAIDVDGDLFKIRLTLPKA